MHNSVRMALIWYAQRQCSAAHDCLFYIYHLNILLPIIYLAFRQVSWAQSWVLALYRSIDDYIKCYGDKFIQRNIRNISTFIFTSEYQVGSGTLQCRHNGRDSVLNLLPHDCLLNRLFKRRSKQTLTLRVTGLRAGNSPVTGEFPVQTASNAENVSIWWRHHE